MGTHASYSSAVGVQNPAVAFGLKDLPLINLNNKSSDSEESRDNSGANYEAVLKSLMAKNGVDTSNQATAYIA